MAHSLVPLQAAPAQARLFLRLRGRLLRNGLRLLLERSRLRLALVIVLGIVICAGLYYLSGLVFGLMREIDTPLLTRAKIVKLLFGGLFLALGGLMVFSTGLLLHSSMFRSPEAGFLLTTPAQPDQIFGYKFQEALLFGGWAFLLLGTPLLVAYGVEVRAPWYFYLLLPLFLVGFLLLPGALGAIGCLLIVTYLTRKRKQVLIALLVLLVVGVGLWVLSAASGAPTHTVSQAWLRKLIRHLEPAQVPLLPSQWMTSGLVASAAGSLGDGLYYLGLLWSNGLFFYLLCAALARRVYRPAFSRVASTGGQRRRYGPHWTDRLLGGLLCWADRRTRIFVLKDVRTFRRDPVQWAQVLILGGILLLYFLNIPYLPHSHYGLYQRVVIGLLNLAVVGLMLATYTSRFVFPLMSLEGRNFWILGLLPIARDRLLWNKFAYAGTVSVGTILLLTAISDLALGLPALLLVFHLFAMVVLALGLSAISVGLGAYLVNLKETNPTKIATGYGGTINLLVSLVYAVAVVLLAGVPTFLYFANRELRQYDVILIERLGLWLGVSTVGLVVLGAAAVVVPLRLGIRAFRTMEF